VTLRATLFDMDGLLIDSEILWEKAEKEIFGDLGVPIAQYQGRLTKGLFVDEVVKFWYERHPWSGPSREEVSAMVLSRVGDLVESEGVLLPGVEHALALCSERGPIALASSTPLALIHRCLDAFGLRSRFETLSSAEFEAYGKPHPAVFLTSAKSLEVDPTQCLVFEDSSAGVLAAKAGRMTVVAVPVPEDKELPAFGLADLVLNSLNDLSPTWLDEQFA
jgi:mannitol-1-/sugar-/sorbitol-6-/2-deoxyglucose-6-phosphatase